MFSACSGNNIGNETNCGRNFKVEDEYLIEYPFITIVSGERG